MLPRASPFYPQQHRRLFRLKSYGIFGETYFDFDDKLKLTLGLRYNHDDKFVRARDDAGRASRCRSGTRPIASIADHSGG